MSEAKDDSAQKPKPVTMTIDEVNNLVDRLCDRANSIENIGTRDLVADLRLIAKVVRAMLRAFNRADVIMIESGA